MIQRPIELGDRQYASELRRPSVLPGLSMISINTWIIVINVLVFVLGITVLNTPYRITTGTERARGVTEDQWAHKWVYHDQTQWTGPGEGYHLILTDRDADGRPVVNLEAGRPMLIPIGRERFAIRPVLDALGHFSTGKAFSEGQVWRFFTFQFLHANALHLGMNMLGLWFVGGIVEEYLGRRRYAAFYLTCGFMGGVMYLFLNLAGYMLSQWFPSTAHTLPFLLVDDPYTPLVGASAGVFGVLLAAAYIAPNAIVDVLFVLPMKLRTAVYLFLLIAVANLFRGGTNAGGDAAHVGGALAGFYLVRHTHKLRDILSVFGLRDQSSRDRRHARVFDSDARSEAELERLIRKAREQGLESLTPGEQRWLRGERERLNPG